MIKKISAIVLALVLCLSVVVVPASAVGVELGEASVAFALEWDKTSYKGGDTAVLKVYMDAADDISLGAGAIMIGLNSAVFNQTDNPIADVKANSTTDATFRTYYKGADTQLSWFAETSAIAGKVTAANTEAEKGICNHYLKYTVAKDTTGGTHANTSSNTAGFGGDEFDPTTPIFTVALKVAADVEPGTVVRAIIPTGSRSISPKQTYFKHYTGTSTPVDIAVEETIVTQADTNTAANGGAEIEAAKQYEDSIVSFVKDQIRMDKADNSEFSIRHIAKISKTDWEAKFGTDEDAGAAGTKNIKSIGFMFKANAELDKDTAANWLEANYADLTAGTQVQGDGFLCMPVSVVSTKLVENSYAFTCVIDGQTDKNNKLSSLAYVVWADDEGTVHFSYFEDVKTTDSFATLYDAYVEAHK